MITPKPNSDRPSTFDELSGVDTTLRGTIEKIGDQESNEEPIESDFFGDVPIEDPSADTLGYGVFAASIAKCVIRIKEPEGCVVAVNGPWGVGKSSVINLVENILKDDASSPIIVRFDSWCYRSEDGVVYGFFQEFYSSVALQSNERAVNWKPLLKLGAKATEYANFASRGLDLFAPGVSAVISSSYKILEKMTEEPEGIEELRRQSCEKLKMIDRRIVVIIDDIDRLSPEEAMAVFRLIKSVGRLTSVVYLLAYDRIETERMIENRYKFSGSHYLEKIVQASFDLPELNQLRVVERVNSRFAKIFGESMHRDSHRLQDVIRNIVIPETRTLRDVHRLANIISVTYQSVEFDVDIADFVALETFRLFRRDIYQKIRSHKKILTNTENIYVEYFESSDNFIRREIFSNEENDVYIRLKEKLIDIFPILNENSWRSFTKFIGDFNQENRVCSALHFDTYFRFSVSEVSVSDADFQEFCYRSSESEFVMKKLRDYMKVEAAYEKSKTSILLEKISYTQASIRKSDVKPFLVTLYSISSELCIEPDSINWSRKGENNNDKIIQVSRSLLDDRFDISETSDIMLSACMVTPLEFKIYLCRHMHRYYHHHYSRYGAWRFLTKKATASLREIVLTEIRHAIRDNKVASVKNFPDFLLYWNDISDIGDEVRREFNDILMKGSKNVLLMAKQFMRWFSDESKYRRHRAHRVTRIGRVIDVQNFIAVLYRTLADQDLSRKDKKVVSRLAKILGEKSLYI